ncbi:MAG: DUF2812 domain-containing protein [Paenibacillus sp.]|nr:DUF2812 domain-containing protein [Paenibacillus sp.]
MKKNKEIRYVSSWGLAFAEEREMKKLSKWASKGWLFESFAFTGFKLRKGDAQNIVYSVDYNTLSSTELQDYVDTFRAAGWEHVCSLANIHVFSAPPGTIPIYTDRATSHDKYSRAIISFQWSSLLFGLLSLIGYVASYYSDNNGINTTLSIVLFIFSTLCLIIAVPSVMVYCAYKFRKYRLK